MKNSRHDQVRQKFPESRPSRRYFFAILFSLGAPGSTALASEVQVEEGKNDTSATPASAAEKQAIAFRRDLGFRSDFEHIRRVAATGASSSRQFGSPFTISEIKEMKRRNDLAESGGRLRDALGGNDEFSGMWVDNGAGGQLVVAVKGKVTQERRKSLLRQGGIVEEGSVRFVEVDRGEKKLSTILDSITVNEQSNWGSRGWQIQSATIDTPSAKIAVGLSSTAPSVAKQEILSKYGEIVVVTQSAGEAKAALVNRDFRNGFLYGGAAISSGSGDSYRRCTIAHSNVRDRETGAYLTLTAEHCGKGIALQWRQGLAGTRFIGKELRTSFRSSGDPVMTCDCMAIGPIRSGTGTESWLINGNAVERFTGQPNATAVGQSYCHSGVTTMMYDNGSVQCGVVKSVTDSRYIRTPGYTLQSGIVINMYCRPGDSGGAVGNFGKLAGLVSWYNSETGECGLSNINRDYTIGVDVRY